MFFKRRSNIIFRNYETFGYITDNRNFGYTSANENKNDIGDKILSESGAVFFSALDKKPQSLDELAKKINEKFSDVDIGTIKDDAKEFYLLLEQDGFVVSGGTIYECEKKDTKFSYKIMGFDVAKDYSQAKIYPERSTQEFFEEYYKDKPQLTNMHIEITSRCNERCVHCYIPHENKTSDIEPDLFYDILEQCRTMRLLHLTLSGGEPMLHKSFCDFLRKCREYNFSVNVLSNLTLLNDEVIEEMKANPLLGVQVSLYSMNPNIHDEITQMKGSCEKTKKAILKLIENDIPLQISCPIMKQNKYCYDDVKNWAKSHKIRVGSDFVLIGRCNHTTQNLSNRLSIDEVQEFINGIIVNDTSYFGQMEEEAEKKRNIAEDDYVCSVCHSSICIAENGNVYPCAGWQGYNISNVKNAPLEDIWNNSEKIQYLRDLRRKDFPKCIQCIDKEFCTMCMVRNANEDPQGDPLAVNEYFCSIAKLNRNMMFEWKERFINSQIQR